MTHLGEVPSLAYWPIKKKTAKTDFGCGEKQIDDYYRKDAWKYHASARHRVTCCSVNDVESAAGFYALACITEEIKKLPGNSILQFGQSPYFPCLQLAFMGVHKPMQRARIGLTMLGKIVTTFAEVGDTIGLPHLIVIPVNADVKLFYSKMGFEEYDKGARMFLPLQTAKAVTET